MGVEARSLATSIQPAEVFKSRPIPFIPRKLHIFLRVLAYSSATIAAALVVAPLPLPHRPYRLATVVVLIFGTVVVFLVLRLHWSMTVRLSNDGFEFQSWTRSVITKFFEWRTIRQADVIRSADEISIRLSKKWLPITIPCHEFESPVGVLGAIERRLEERGIEVSAYTVPKNASTVGGAVYIAGHVLLEVIGPAILLVWLATNIARSEAHLAQYDAAKAAGTLTAPMARALLAPEPVLWVYPFSIMGVVILGAAVFGLGESLSWLRPPRPQFWSRALGCAVPAMVAWGLFETIWSLILLDTVRLGQMVMPNEFQWLGLSAFDLPFRVAAYIAVAALVGTFGLTLSCNLLASVIFVRPVSPEAGAVP